MYKWLVEDMEYVVRAENAREIKEIADNTIGIKEIFELLKLKKAEYIGINIFTQNFNTVKEIVENCPVTTTIIIGGQVVKCIYSKY